MWQAVLLFAVIGVGFLLARLPEEMEEYDADLTAERVVAACAGTPVESAAAELEITEEMLERHSDVVGFERGNLVLVLLIAQAIQVLLLAVAVWVFFLVFGIVAIDDAVIEEWVGNPPHYAGGFGLVSRELVQVSTFLAAFAGLYFTVYAVTDGNYRKQFFTRIRRELERAVSVRLVYRSLLEWPRVGASSTARGVSRRFVVGHGSTKRRLAGSQEASRSCSTRAAILSTASWSSPATSTVSPLPAPSVMISSDELASTPLMVTSEPSSPAASAMIAAGRACRPTADPTTTDLLGMGSPWVVGCSRMVRVVRRWRGRCPTGPSTSRR